MSLQLVEILKSKNEELFNNLSLVKKKAEILLSQIIIDFPQYTSHDIKHSEIVITRLNTIVSDTLKKELNEYEIFFLLCSAYLHDVGMANLKHIGDKWGENPDTIRENHHKRSCIFIRDFYEKIGLDDPHQGKNIGKICLGHRKENLHDINLFPPRKAYKNYKINIPLLASLLRIADELDITFERTPKLFHDNFNINNKKSKEEWEKHLSIEGVISIHNNSFIQCDATCEDYKIHRILKKLEEKVNGQLEDLPSHMHDYSEFIKELPRTFSMEIENIGYKDYNFKFSLDNKSIFDLLVGKHLYKSEYECIRELLKNSVDACRFRQISKNSFKPKITFELTESNEKLIVSDNGMGMDEFIIEKYFTKIGRSFYRSKEFYNNELDFDPLNELGIGFLSCFMISDNIVIDTKVDKGNPLKIEIDKKADYFLVRDSDMQSTGTKITLNLKEDIKKDIDLEAIIRKYARHLEYSIDLIIPNHKKIEIKNEGFLPCIQTMQRKPYLKRKSSKFKNKNSIIKICNDDFEGHFCFFYEEDYYNMKNIVFKSRNKRNTLSNQGILVNDKIKLLPKPIRDLCSLDINLKKNVLNLNVARNNIVRDKKYNKFLDKLELLLFDKIRELLLEINNSCNIDDFLNNYTTKFHDDCWNLILINSFFEKYYDIFEHNKNLNERYSKLFFDFYSFTCISNEGISFVKMKDLINQKIIYIDLDLEGFVKRSYLNEYLEHLFKYMPLNEDYVYIIRQYSVNKILESFLNHEPELFSILLIKEFGLNFTNIPHDNEKYNMFTIDSNIFQDNKLILFPFKDKIVINKNNKFIQFILNNIDNFNDTDNLIIKTLFDNPLNILSLHENYKRALDHFISNKMINKDDIPYYSLDEKELDFCRNNYIWKHE
ncbi:Chaperone protein HtpG [bioreactor metagenome]|uniref:Chaperone protein HtpG n=1 Tax=bioreactor metagenome TaxID=1076179 RepID=A0A644T7R2_9ZZZZ|nr:HD domain-containing protein [Methanobrevibacter sp.]MEA4957217.1 ATP-binding protein [Methanobrevibacter sp.]